MPFKDHSKVDHSLMSEGGDKIEDQLLKNKQGSNDKVKTPKSNEVVPVVEKKENLDDG